MKETNFQENAEDGAVCSSKWIILNIRNLLVTDVLIFEEQHMEGISIHPLARLPGLLHEVAGNPKT